MNNHPCWLNCLTETKLLIINLSSLLHIRNLLSITMYRSCCTVHSSISNIYPSPQKCYSLSVDKLLRTRWSIVFSATNFGPLIRITREWMDTVEPRPFSITLLLHQARPPSQGPCQSFHSHLHFSIKPSNKLIRHSSLTTLSVQVLVIMLNSAGSTLPSLSPTWYHISPPSNTRHVPGVHLHCFMSCIGSVTRCHRIQNSAVS